MCPRLRYRVVSVDAMSEKRMPVSYTCTNVAIRNRVEVTDISQRIRFVVPSHITGRKVAV